MNEVVVQYSPGMEQCLALSICSSMDTFNVYTWKGGIMPAILAKTDCACSVIKHHPGEGLWNMKHVFSNNFKCTEKLHVNDMFYRSFTESSTIT